MGNESGVLLLVVLAVLVVVLIIAKAMDFFTHFNSDTRYICARMDEAEDDNEYRCWRRELRCHYLCLIPFVTRRNVKPVYDFFFHKKKRETGLERKDSITHILAPSMLGMCICAICLCGASWAWFTSTTGSSMQAITTPQYDLSVTVTGGADEINGTSSKEGTKYTLTGGTTYAVTLSATGTDRATGYCVVQIDGTTYYSEQIFAVSEFTFTVEAGKDCEMTITTNWGTCALEIPDKIKQGSVIDTENGAADTENSATGTANMD